ncbi:Hypothetical_protein [Hexamita inflata]|uniref:Hypothetical_protein n=1 Tax=Hexamita inflata TaxID=28002 RepID=A0AA86Q8X3_9EUKA|nr:Hypothetical protein HINF_LOCUS41113 [Hexamita inflata]
MLTVLGLQLLQLLHEVVYLVILHPQFGANTFDIQHLQQSGVFTPMKHNYQIQTQLEELHLVLNDAQLLQYNARQLGYSRERYRDHLLQKIKLLFSSQQFKEEAQK